MTAQIKSLQDLPGAIEAKYRIAVNELKENSRNNPLLEKEIETPRDAAIVLDKIVRFFYYENADYLTEDTDYKAVILEAISELYKFLKTAGVETIREMYAQFQTSGEIGTEQIETKANELFKVLAKNDLPKYLEILFSPFATLAGYRQESSHGSVGLRAFAAYAKLIGGGKLYPEHRLDNIVRPEEGVAALTTLLPEDSVATLSTKFPGKVYQLVKTSDGEADTTIAIHEQEEDSSNDQGLIEKEGEDIGVISPGAVLRLSKAKAGRIGRREAHRQAKEERKLEEEKEQNQELYNQDLERLENLSAFIQQQFERLRIHLLEKIPYVAELLDYATIVEKLKKLGYETETIEVVEVKKELAKKITELQGYISQEKARKIKAEKQLHDITNEIGIATNTRKKEIQRKIGRLHARIARSKDYIEGYTQEMEARIAESSTLFDQFKVYRIIRFPTREQFRMAFYASLRALELYQTSENPIPGYIDQKWIEAEVVPHFEKVLGNHLIEFNGISLPELRKLLEEIAELPTEYDPEIILPDTSDISQTKVQAFFDMLLPIIPEDYLEEIPNPPTIVTPEGIIQAPPIAARKSTSPEVEKNAIGKKVRKTHGEVRALKAERDAQKQALYEELTQVQDEIKKYLGYWKEEIVQLFRKRKRIRSDIQKLSTGMHRSMFHKGQDLDGLNEMEQVNIQSVSRIEEEIRSGKFIDDQEAYEQLIKRRSDITKKNQRLH